MDIKELARQAGGIDISTTKGGGVTIWLGTDRPEFLEAFAKLVAEKAFKDGYAIGEARGFKDAIKLERARGEA